MSISSRTPEGDPHRCPICGKVSWVKPSYPSGDSCCSNCGQLLWWFRDRLCHDGRIAPEQVTLSSSFIDDLGADSLDTAELIIELEEEFGIVVPNDDVERIKTVADAIRYIEKHRQE